MKVLEYINGRECVVQPFNDGYKPVKNIGIINGALAYDVGNGETYILLLNQALDFRDSMEHLLLLVNQARHNNVVIDDIAPHLDYYKKSKYEIFFPDSNKSVKLSPTNKSINHVKVRYPSDYDLDNYPHLSLTSEDNWNPNETTLDEISAITLYSDNLYHRLISNVHISTKYHRKITKESLA